MCGPIVCGYVGLASLLRGLIVDDSPSFREAMRALLEAEMAELAPGLDDQRERLAGSGRLHRR